MEIYRFSNDGFKSQYQHHHYNQMLLCLDEEYLKEELDSAPEHLKRICLKRQEERKPFIEENLLDFKYGIWVFTDLDNFMKRSLNHLKTIPKLWRAEIPDDTIVYDVDFNNKYTIAKCPCAESVGCYVPEKELDSITNIKEYIDFLNIPYEEFKRIDL